MVDIYSFWRQTQLTHKIEIWCVILLQNYFFPHFSEEVSFNLYLKEKKRNPIYGHLNLSSQYQQSYAIFFLHCHILSLVIKASGNGWSLPEKNRIVLLFLDGKTWCNWEMAFLQTPSLSRWKWNIQSKSHKLKALFNDGKKRKREEKKRERKK